jgi:surface polysaccharide O-acyltransferase-like enzyme
MTVPVASIPAPQRWPLIDVSRWFAMYAIVWLHTIRSEALLPSAMITRFAVPFFVATCVFLIFQGVAHKPQRTFTQYAWSRFVRIYLPFLAWCAIYLAFKAVKSHFLPEQRNEFPGVLEVFWKGSFGHLWFMPFIFAVSLVAFLVAKTVQWRELLRWPIALGAFAIGAAMVTPRVAAVITPDDLTCSLIVFALPAMLWAMTVALICNHGAQQPWAALRRLRVDVLLFVGSMVWLAILGTSSRSMLRENLAGTSLLLVGLRPTTAPLLCRIARFPALAYGIYFAHMLPVKVCEALAARRGLALSWQLDCTIFAVSAIGATLLAWALYQSRWTRWLVA